MRVCNERSETGRRGLKGGQLGSGFGRVEEEDFGGGLVLECVDFLGGILWELGEWQIGEFQAVSEVEERIRYLMRCGFVVSVKYLYCS